MRPPGNSVLQMQTFREDRRPERKQGNFVQPLLALRAPIRGHFFGFEFPDGLRRKLLTFRQKNRSSAEEVPGRFELRGHPRGRTVAPPFQGLDEIFFAYAGLRPGLSQFALSGRAGAGPGGRRSARQTGMSAPRVGTPAVLHRLDYCPRNVPLVIFASDIKKVDAFWSK